MKTTLIILLAALAALLAFVGVHELNAVDAIELQRVYGYTYRQALNAVTDAQIAFHHCMACAVIALLGAGAVAKYVRK